MATARRVRRTGIASCCELLVHCSTPHWYTLGIGEPFKVNERVSRPEGRQADRGGVRVSRDALFSSWPCRSAAAPGPPGAGALRRARSQLPRVGIAESRPRGSNGLHASEFSPKLSLARRRGAVARPAALHGGYLGRVTVATQRLGSRRPCQQCVEVCAVQGTRATCCGKAAGRVHFSGPLRSARRSS